MAVLGVGEEFVEGGAIEILAAEPDGLDLRGVVNVGEGIGGEEGEVGAPAAMEPSSLERPRNSAGRSVAACRVASGVRPDSTSRASSSCRLKPGVGIHGVGAGKNYLHDGDVENSGV